MDNLKAVIGIGASAGGLEAIRAFMTGIQEDDGFAFIIAQHLSPAYPSQLSQLLEKGAPVKILTAENGQLIEANTAYVCPPDSNIEIQNGHLLLDSTHPERFLVRPSVDLLFESMVNHYGYLSVAVVLSGTGSDGSRGIMAVKTRGGLTLVQDPADAKFDGMPNQAIKSGMIDNVLPANEMMREIRLVFADQGERPGFLQNEKLRRELDLIMKMLRDASDIDFSRFKISTIKYSLQNRMNQLELKDFQDYIKVLNEQPEELRQLARKIPVHVSDFFQNQNYFDSIHEILSDYLQKSSDKNLRIWVAGCATGEEAYSHAILINEIFKSRGVSLDFQVFATDINADAIKIARRGYYSASHVDQLPANIIENYFEAQNDGYTVNRTLRDSCIFSVHNLDIDPPFLRLDLITCRNYLVKFNRSVQDQILNSFHFALKKHGLLVIGNDTSLSPSFINSLNSLDKNHNIFQSSTDNPRQLLRSSIAKPSKKTNQQLNNNSISHSKELQNELEDFFIRNALPSYISVNEQMKIIFAHGENPYLSSRSGQRNDNLYNNLLPELSSELHVMMDRLVKTNNPQYSTLIQVDLYGQAQYVQLSVYPMLRKENSAPLYVIYFHPQSTEFINSIALNDSHDCDDQLRKQLSRAHHNVQTILEQMEESQEDLRSLNEELEVSNEELQSSNEELETTNEELQATNEELHAAYAELQMAYNSKQREIDSHFKTRKLLTQNSERLEMALHSSGLGICDLHNPTETGDIWSPRFAQLLGYNIEELPSAPEKMLSWFREQIHTDHLTDYLKQSDQFLDGKIIDLNISFRCQHKNRSWVWIKQQAKAVSRDSDGTVLRFIATFANITSEIAQRAEIEQLNKSLFIKVHEQQDTIKEQDASLKQVERELQVAFWSFDINTQLVSLSPWVKKLLSASNQDNISLQNFTSLFNISQQLHDDLLALQNDDISHLRERASIKHPDGSERWYLLFAEKKGNDLNAYISGTLLDITKETLREQLLEKVSDHITLIQEIEHIGLFEFDPKRQIFWRSKEYCQLLQMDPLSQTVGSLESMLNHLNDEDVKAYHQYIVKVLSNPDQVQSIEYQFFRDQQSFMIIEKSISRDGRINGTIQTQS